MKETHETDLQTVVEQITEHFESVAGIYASHGTPSLLTLTVSTADIVDEDESVNLFDAECRVPIQRGDNTVEYQVEVVASPFAPQTMDTPEQTPVYVAPEDNSAPLPLDTGIQHLHDKLEHSEQYDHNRIGDHATRQIRNEYES